MGRSHSSGGRSGGGGGFRSSGRSHLSTGSSSFSRHHVSRIPRTSHHTGTHYHHHRHIRGPHIHTSVHISGPVGAIFTIILLYLIFFLAPMFMSFSSVNQNLDEIKSSYYYYQNMIRYAKQNSAYQMKGIVKGIYEDTNYEDAWYLKYTVYNPHNPNQVYVTEYTFSVYESEDISKINIGDEIMIAVDNPTPPIFDSIDMNYANVELDDDPEYDYYEDRKESLIITFTIYGIIATSIASISLFFVIKSIIKKSKQDKDNTSLNLNKETVSEESKTTYCEYCGVSLDSSSDKCKVCGARNNNR